MAWERYFRIDIDVDNPSNPLLAKGLSTSRQAFSWTQGDQFPLRIYPRSLGQLGNPSTSEPVPAGSAIVLGAKKKVSGLITGDLLFSATGFSEVVDGDDTYYTAELDLNTTELNTEFSDDSVGSITCQVDIEVQTAGNTQRTTFRFDMTIAKQAYANESSPTPAEPSYPSPSSLVVKNVDAVDIPNGADTLSITGLALDSAPAQILLTLRKPSAAAANIVPMWIDGSESTDGFDVELNAPTPSTGYKLDYLIIL